MGDPSGSWSQQPQPLGPLALGLLGCEMTEHPGRREQWRKQMTSRQLETRTLQGRHFSKARPQWLISSSQTPPFSFCCLPVWVHQSRNPLMKSENTWSNHLPKATPLSIAWETTPLIPWAFRRDISYPNRGPCCVRRRLCSLVSLGSIGRSSFPPSCNSALEVEAEHRPFCRET